jgi:SAM-dependent methyltransferase
MERLEDVEREARERLYPSLTNPSWLVLRRRREIFQKWLARQDTHDLDVRDLDVLDLGGRIQPYRPLLKERARRYVAVDLRQTPLVNIVARGEQIPLASGRFDLVICTQVLEYVPNPAEMIAEIHRVLKPGGCLFLSVPSASVRDAEQDAWRFLPAALRQLLTGFSELEIVPEGGSLVGFFRTVNVCLHIFVRYKALRMVYRWTICPVLNLCGELLEHIAKSSNDQFTPNYSAWAQK